MKPRRLLRCLGFALLTLSNALPTLDAAQDAFDTILKPALRKHCVQCHGQNDTLKGDVNLLALQNAADLTKSPKLLGRMIEVLDLEEMPPGDAKPLQPTVRLQMVQALKKILRASVSEAKIFPRTPIRRLNRFQYNNAVQDLFELKVLVFPLPERLMREYEDYFQPASGALPAQVMVGNRALGKSQMIEPRLAGVEPFPQDLRAEHGFDTQGDHLSLSPFLMESFLSLSRSIVGSRDFNAQNCGIWHSFFEAPQASTHPLAIVVQQRLRKFLTRAFRHPVNDKLLGRYLAHVLARLRTGNSFTESMKSVAAATLASPRFLYLYDEAASNPSRRVDEFALASRLSFFLWGSIPDAKLLELATDGRLSDRGMLREQVQRMLRDRRLKRFCDSFPSQWLQLDRLISSVPDEKKFPNFYSYAANFRSSSHMMLEPLLLFETILIEDRSILDLVDSDYTYRTPRLQNWYSASPIERDSPGTHKFARVPITDRRQGGVITTTAVMTMTSGPEESKPITRGAWIASVIFNNPPNPPPADVPPLESATIEQKDLTVRERFKEHRTRPACAGCHAKLDPLGFALENFDAVGRWRDDYANGRTVDASGVLFRKHKFENIIEFKDAILLEKDRFTRAFAAHILAFALGRRVDATDFPALDEIVDQTAQAGYSMQTLIHEIIQSQSFVGKMRPPRKKTTRL